MLGIATGKYGLLDGCAMAGATCGVVAGAGSAIDVIVWDVLTTRCAVDALRFFVVLCFLVTLCFFVAAGFSWADSPAPHAGVIASASAMSELNKSGFMTFSSMQR
ncbi:MAG: hypothetical protein PHX10_01215 [Gallionellaceae bacterium]|nr:hypothetical protein [Gallionellaceae bacterium]